MTKRKLLLTIMLTTSILITLTYTCRAQDLPKLYNIQQISYQTPEQKQTTAVLLARAGKYNEAIYILEILLKANHPSSPDNLLYDYIVILNWSGQHNQAIEFATRRWQGNFTQLPNYVISALADSLYRTGQYTKALELYRQNPTANTTMIEKSLLFLNKKSIETLSLETQKSFALDLARANRISESIAIYQKLLAENKLTKTDLYDYLTILSWAGLSQQALDIFENQLSGDISSLPNYAKHTIGGIYQQQKNTEQAIFIYKTAGAQGDTGSLLAAAYLMAENNQLELALGNLNQFIQQDPEEAKYYIWRAKAYLKAGHLYEAAQDYETALSLIPTDFLAYRREIQAEQAVLFLRAGEYSFSIQILAPYIKNHQATLTMQSDYIVALKNSGAFALAIAEAEKMWPQKDNVPAYALLALAEAYLTLGDSKTAIKYYDLIIKTTSPEKQTAIDKKQAILNKKT